MTYGKLRSCKNVYTGCREVMFDGWIAMCVITVQDGVRLPRPRRLQTSKAIEKAKEKTAARTRSGLTDYRGGEGEQGLVIRVPQ